MSVPERTLFASDLVAVGTFRCPPDHVAFPGGVVDTYLVAFPRTAVRIERERAEPVVADPATAVTYQPATTYRRFKVDARGDLCDYFAVDETIASSVDPDGKFWSGGGFVPAPIYLEQRRIVDLVAATAADPLEVEERVVDVVTAVAGRPYSERDGDPSLSHQALAMDTSAYLAKNYRTKLDLSGIGRAVGSSPYHLSRLFRVVTGSTIHQRLNTLRLRAALEELRDPRSDISRVAVELGFSSHSHLTRSFKAEFGAVPSAYRAEVARFRTIMQAGRL